MIEHPEDYIEKFAEAGADVIEFHIETAPEPDKLIQQIHDLGKKAGIALNPDTSIDMISSYLDKVDIVLIMSVHPGFGGQEFIDVTEKVKELRAKYKGIIEIDGGINNETAKIVNDAEANSLVSGSYIFHSENPLKTVEELRKLLK
jgi:ribulose-phosphate 3-epimerase